METVLINRQTCVEHPQYMLIVVRKAIKDLLVRIQQGDSVWLCCRIGDAVATETESRDLNYRLTPSRTCVTQAIVQHFYEFCKSVNRGVVPSWWDSNRYTNYDARLEAMRAYEKHLQDLVNAER